MFSCFDWASAFFKPFDSRVVSLVHLVPNAPPYARSPLLSAKDSILANAQAFTREAKRMADLSSADLSERNAIYVKNSAVSNTFTTLVIRITVDRVHPTYKCRL